MIGDASQGLAGWRRQRCNAEKSEVGFVRQGRKVDRRRESKVSRLAAPKGHNSRGIGKLSSKARRKGRSKTRVGDGPGSRAGDATAGVRTFGSSGRAGRLIRGASRGWLEGSAEGISGRRESEVRFEGATGRLNKGASRRSAGRLDRKVERRREPESSWKIEPEDDLKAQAGEKSDGRLDDRQAAQVACRSESWARRQAGDASQRSAGRQVTGLIANASWRLT